jgi:H+-translocating diphosphatase
MILSGSLAVEAKLPLPMSFVYFPVMVHAFDILVSSAGILAVGDGSRGSGFGGNVSTEMDPLRIMKRGYRVSLACAAVIFLCLTRWLLYVPFAPYAWLSYFFCGVVGMITSYVFILSTQASHAGLGGGRDAREELV